MFLTELTTVASASLPLAALKDHMQLGTGFTIDPAQDALIESYLRAAIAAIEARTGKVLLERGFSWSLTGWREACRQALPLAPVRTVDAVRVVDRTGQATLVAATGYRLEQDAHRPSLWAQGSALPSIPLGGTAEVDFTAGFGAAWADIPADLGQAAFLLATHFYENRNAAAGEVAMPYGASSLIERYRNVRILGGGVR